MSKTYRCRVKVDLKERVVSRDAVEYEIDLGRILGKDEESELLRSKLLNAGGVERDGKIVIDVEGVPVEIDPTTRKAVASVEGLGDVERHLDEERKIYNVADDEAGARRRAQADAEQAERAALEAEKARLQRELDTQVRGKLADASRAIVRRLRELRGEVEREAVLRKAERLGRLVSQHESEDTKSGDRTLVIELEIPD